LGQGRDGRVAGEPRAAGALVLAIVEQVVLDLHPGTYVPRVHEDAHLERELGLDSLAVMELVDRLEREFGVTVPDDQLASLSTPRDLLGAVVAAAPAAPRAVRAPPPSSSPAPEERAAAPDEATSLGEVLRWHADAHPDQLHLRLLGEEGAEELTYGTLWSEAAEVAAGLRGAGVSRGASVAIMLPTGRDYFVAFCGTLLAGGVPVPVYPPARPSQLEEHVRRHARILVNARAECLVTVGEARPLARLLAPLVPGLRLVTTVGRLRSEGDRVTRPLVRADPDATALLQYTSGSTGDPKGVVLTHANLLANIHAMRQAGRIIPDDVFVSWLPLYHDMGLIGAWLSSLVAGIPLVVMSPLTFLARPSRWLWAIHDHHGTLSGGPNFGYELCLRRIEEGELTGLDLSSWRIAFNGAEPVSAATVSRFAERFAAFGLDRGAITPVYGLAESCVALTVPPLGRGPRIDHVERTTLARTGRAVPARADDRDAVRVVACGPALPGHQLRIVDRHGAELDERRQGRLQFRGPSATSGYHRNPEATERLLDGDWLETGDLGYLVDDELHLTGRVKDLIIRAGQNLHPGELEEAVGDLDHVRRGCVAVFPATDRLSGTERLVVLAETHATDEDTRAEIRRRVTTLATDLVGTPPDEVVLAGPGTVPKTSSGKIRRTTARDRYERDELEPTTLPPWAQLLRLTAAGLLPRARRAVRDVVARAHGVRALALFSLAVLVVWPLVLLLPDPVRRWQVIRRAGRLLLRLSGVQLTVEGADHLASARPFVVAANHASNLDALVLALVLPPPVVFAAIEGIAVNPMVRVFLRRLDVHLLGGGDRRRGPRHAQTLTGHVRAGRVVVFFPEGRRSHATGLERFRMGAFTVAADAGAPVVPIALRGTRVILPVGTILPRRGDIEVTVCEPVTTERAGWAGAVELHRATRACILRHTGEPDLG
jgi:acyl carrier protein